ncbi:hypothetical protein BKA56DRAFT_672707 [Ilyonectria sp. MPI-CAGE-AT-0026]|nr:hypothetical protein BKA56DRAFT_672707 [Ilyonectria sp. MPI-CAGE-AT-0026]
MGNAPSSEDLRRPQKLSKPQLGNYVPAAGLPNLTVDVNSHHGRFSNSYLVGSVPISPTNSSPVDPTHPGIGIAIGGEDLENTDQNSRRDSRLWSVVSRTRSFKSDHLRSRSMVATGSRRGSFVSDGALPFAHSESLPTAVHRGSANFDVRAYEDQRLLTLDREMSDESSTSTPERQSPTRELTENTWKSSHPTQERTSIVRSASDVSLYTPMRRRSIVQTPGVATRAHRRAPSAKSNFPSSLPTTPSHTRHSSIASDAVEVLSVPLVKFGSQPPERVVTPCEAEYKQLGGIKFGSLRIMNGSPKLSPRPEKGNKMESESTPTKVSYFGRQAPLTKVADPNECLQKPLSEASNSMAANKETTSETNRHQDGSLSENGNGQEYSTAEVLDVRDDPNAKPTAERIRLELESKALKSLNRSDSGFVSSPSSEGSRKAASKADSGYSSNVSLRSLRSLRSAVTDIGRKSPQKTQGKSSERLNSEKVGSLPGTATGSGHFTPKKMEIQQRPGTTMVMTPLTSSNVSPAKSSSHPSLARGSRMRVPSLKDVKQEPQSPKSRPQSSSARSQEQVRVAGSTSCPPTPILSQHPSRTAHGSRMQRMLSAPHRKGPPKVRNNRTADKTLHRSRSDISSHTTGNKVRFSKASRRPMIHDDKSKETLRTIMSVGSTDVLQCGPGRQGNKAQDLAKQEMDKSTPKTPRRGSFRARAKSLTQAATTLLISGKTSMTKVSKDIEVEGPPKAEVVGNARVQSGNESDTANRAERRPINKSKPTEPRTNSRPIPAPRRSSMPALPATHSSLLNQSNAALYRANKTKSPPPVSMQTRTGKQSRGQSRGQSRVQPLGQALAHSQQPAPAELAHLRRHSAPRDFRRDLVQSYPPTQGTPVFYGYPSANQIVAMNHQQLANFQGHRTVSWDVGSGSRQSPLLIAHAGYQRTGSTPFQQGRHGHTRVRSRSDTAPPQQQHGQLLPQMQPIHDRNLSGQQWLQHHLVQSHGQVQGMDAMVFREFDRHSTPNPQRGPSRHRRAISHGAVSSQNPPFRVLHSYNSPAYRGVPIWG